MSALYWAGVSAGVVATDGGLVVVVVAAGALVVAGGGRRPWSPWPAPWSWRSAPWSWPSPPGCGGVVGGAPAGRAEPAACRRLGGGRRRLGGEWWSLPEGAVVGVVAGAAVAAPAYGATLQSMGRNRSSAVWPTVVRASCGFLIPGSSITTVLPCRLMFGSATPRASTRLLMMEMAWSRTPLLTFCWGLQDERRTALQVQAKERLVAAQQGGSEGDRGDRR